MPDNRRPALPQRDRGPARVIDQPRAGFFMIRQVRKGPWVPARILVDFDAFSAEIGGKPCGAANEDPLRADGVMRIWEYGREIDEAEYWRLLGRKDAPDPSVRIDLRRKPSLY